MKIRPSSMQWALKIKERLADPGFRIEHFVAGWELTGNPIYLWRVISICSAHGKPLPHAVTDYLAQVAQRMDNAKTTTDLRKVLPGIMGFPMRRGPGRPLDPDAGDDPDRFFFALRFGIELEQERTVGEALKNATAHPRLSPQFGDADDKTLKRWIAESIGLKGALPRTAGEWRSAVRSRIISQFEKLDQLIWK